MKSSLAFTGAVLVAFVTGAVLIKTIDFSYGAVISHILSLSTPDDADSDREATNAAGFELDSAFVAAATGAFIPNLGQERHNVYFQHIGRHWIANFRAASIRMEERAEFRSRREGRRGINLRFIGANANPKVRADERRGGTSLDIANGGSAMTLPRFAEIAYLDLYDGVELRLSDQGSRLKWRFTFSPGIDSKTLLLHHDGADHPEVLSSGELRISTPEHTISYPRPKAYQKVGKSHVPVQVSYEMGRFGSFGFSVAAYDHRLPLMIEVEGVRGNQKSEIRNQK